MRSLGLPAVCTVAVFLAGCGEGERKADPKSGPPAAPGAPKSVHSAALADVAAEGAAAKSAVPAAPAAAAAAEVEAIAGTDRPRRPPDRGLRPGVLTAASFDDTLTPEFFRRFTHAVEQNPQVPGLAARMRGQCLVVAVKDEHGNPVGNARVKAASSQGGGLELTTRSDGRVVFLTSFDDLPTTGAVDVTVTPPGGGAPVAQAVPVQGGRWDVVLPGVRAAAPRKLDLVLVLDTTGSMGKELEYLKSEWQGIAAAVREKFPDVDQRYGLVLYRDEGDEYVARPFPFTPAIEEFRTNLAAQRAAGGGDEPEAVHRGLEEAVQLPWRGEETARVLFLVTDAPPHAQYVGRTMDALNALRKQGVAVYGVKTGNPSDAAELVLRSCSLLTGSRYVFLTDDSGVGNAHGEPHLPYYHVQKLDRLIAGIIEAELRCRRFEPDARDILRSVGTPIN